MKHHIDTLPADPRELEQARQNLDTFGRARIADALTPAEIEAARRRVDDCNN